MNKKNELLTYLGKYGSNNMACTICKGILKNCCQGSCGCLFCEGCIKDYLRKGERYCPGETDRCKQSDLTDNFHMNKNDEASLAKINSTLVEWVLQILNDLRIHGHNQKPEIVKAELDNSQRIIESMVHQFLSTGVLDTPDGNMIVDKLLDTLAELKIKNEEYSKLLEKSSSKTSLQSFPKEFLRRKSLPTVATFPSRHSKEIASFRWEVDNVSTIRKEKKDISSNYFSSQNHAYEMWLNLYSMGTECHTSDISIRFWIQDGTNPLSSNWPFQGNITITTRNKAQPDLFQRCSIDSKIDITLLKPFGRSELFTFQFLDLNLNEKSLNDCLVIECLVRAYSQVAPDSAC